MSSLYCHLSVYYTTDVGGSQHHYLRIPLQLSGVVHSECLFGIERMAVGSCYALPWMHTSGECLQKIEDARE